MANGLYMVCLRNEIKYIRYYAPLTLKLKIMMEGIGGEIAKQVFNKLLIPFAIVFVIGFALGAWLF